MSGERESLTEIEIQLRKELIQEMKLGSENKHQKIRFKLV